MTLTTIRPVLRLDWGECVAAMSLKLQEEGVPGEVAFLRALELYRDPSYTPAPDRIPTNRPTKPVPPPYVTKTRRLYRRVVAYLTEHRKPMTAKELAKALGSDAKAVRDAIQRNHWVDRSLVLAAAEPGTLVRTGYRIQAYRKGMRESLWAVVRE